MYIRNNFLKQPRRGNTREAQLTPHKRSAVWGLMLETDSYCGDSDPVRAAQYVCVCPSSSSSSSPSPLPSLPSTATPCTWWKKSRSMTPSSCTTRSECTTLSRWPWTSTAKALSTMHVKTVWISSMRSRSRTV